MGAPIMEGRDYSNISASTLIKGTAGNLVGIGCNSTGGGTMIVYDNTAGSGTKIANTITLVAGQFYPMPCSFNTGLYVAISGTADVTAYHW